MKTIELTQGKYTLVDDEDYEFLITKKWHFRKGKGVEGYAIHSLHISGSGKERVQIKLRMHRILAGATDEREVDHINGNTLDNRKVNLRLVTSQQNKMNQSVRRSKSGFKGVYFDASRNKWRAKINLSGKQIHLGQYVTKEEAAKAYDKGALEYFGEYAKLNYGI